MGFLPHKVPALKVRFLSKESPVGTGSRCQGTQGGCGGVLLEDGGGRPSEDTPAMDLKEELALRSRPRKGSA